MILATPTTQMQPNEMWPANVAIAVLAIIALLFVLDRLLLLMQRRGEKSDAERKQ
jgi:hypothetical protein